MPEKKTNKYKINYTEQDIETMLLNMFIQLIVDKEHPDIVTRAKQLTQQYIDKHGHGIE